MTRFRKAALAVLAVAAIAAGAAWLARVPLSMALVERTALRTLTSDPVAGLPDGLHVGLCGAGSPFPDPQRAGPCTLVLAGRRLLVFDAGDGAARGIGRLGFDLGRVDDLLLTHLHSDHLDGLGGLLLQRWVAGGHAAPLPVHGPRGVETVVDGLGRAYSADASYRVAHHGAQVVPPSGAGGVARPVDVPDEGRAVVVADGDLEVVAFAVHHEPVHPSLGYRIRYKDRVVVLSGDTKASDAVRREAAGADLLVHEALSVPLLRVLDRAAEKAGRANLRKIFADIPDYHTSPEEAAAIARDAKVGMLLLNHVVPPLPLATLEGAFLGDAPRIWSGPIRVGRDGDFVTLPAGSREIRVGRRP
jgi:ribonuclease Z